MVPLAFFVAVMRVGILVVFVEVRLGTLVVMWLVSCCHLEIIIFLLVLFIISLLTVIAETSSASAASEATTTSTGLASSSSVLSFLFFDVLKLLVTLGSFYARFGSVVDFDSFLEFLLQLGKVLVCLSIGLVLFLEAVLEKPSVFGSLCRYIFLFLFLNLGNRLLLNSYRLLMLLLLLLWFVSKSSEFVLLLFEGRSLRLLLGLHSLSRRLLFDFLLLLLLLHFG